MSSQDCRFFMEQGNEQCELFQRAHIFVRFKNSSHPINWINLYANDTKHRRYASWTLEQHEGDLAVHNVLEPQSLALGMIWKMMNHGETIQTWLVLSCNWSKTSVRSDVLAQSEALAPESVLLTDVLAPPGINLKPPTTRQQNQPQNADHPGLQVVAPDYSAKTKHLQLLNEAWVSQPQQILFLDIKRQVTVFVLSPLTNNLLCIFKLSNNFLIICRIIPDFILNSALGHSSGDVYHQLHQVCIWPRKIFCFKRYRKNHGIFHNMKYVVWGKNTICRPRCNL